jgi:hypothetical protein
MVMRFFRSPAVDEAQALNVYHESRRFFGETWRWNGEVSYEKTGPVTDPTFQFQQLNVSCGINLLWSDEEPQVLSLPAGISATRVRVYYTNLVGQPTAAIEIHPDANAVLSANGINQQNPAYILYPEWVRVNSQTLGETIVTSGAAALGPALATSGGEGSVWQATTGTTYQPLLDLIGPTHELFHLIARAVHAQSSVYIGQDFPDTAWWGLYSPSLAFLGDSASSWDGHLVGGQVLADRPYVMPADAQHWMTASSVTTYFPEPQSQCKFMRDNPRGYLIQAVY